MMKYKILYYYDFWNQREKKELYNIEFHTGPFCKELKVGERLDIHSGTVNQGTAVITDFDKIAPSVYLIKTGSRGILIIKELM